MTTSTPRSSDALAFTTVAPGVEMAVLRRHPDRGATLMFRMAAGAHAPHHDHPGGEETYLVSGKLRIAGTQLTAGDYYYAPPGEVHDGFAEEAAVFFVVAPGGIVPT